MILTALVGIVFSFIFIILAFALPTKEKVEIPVKKPANLLEEVSESFKK